jgi:hypothetical protein
MNRKNQRHETFGSVGANRTEHHLSDHNKESRRGCEIDPGTMARGAKHSEQWAECDHSKTEVE